MDQSGVYCLPAGALLCSLCTAGTYSTGPGNTVCMQIHRGGFCPLWGVSIVLPQHAKTIKAFYWPESRWTTEAISWLDVAYHSSDSLLVCARDCFGSSHPLTCLLFHMQALRQRARAASARLEPIRLGQVRTIRELWVHCDCTWLCMQLFISISIYTAYLNFNTSRAFKYIERLMTKRMIVLNIAR
jgi:hypothetical protein